MNHQTNHNLKIPEKLEFQLSLDHVENCLYSAPLKISQPNKIYKTRKNLARNLIFRMPTNGTSFVVLGKMYDSI